ncbi:unnamed protein product [Ectocarpus sp. 12 AP-2014]
MSRRRKPGGNSLDVVQRLQQRVSEGEFYEALQLYKTSYSRLKAQCKLDDAEELLTAGAIAMSKENELNAATELGLLIVTSFEENGREVDEARLSQLKRVAVAMTPGVEMSEFLKRAIRWTRHTKTEAAFELRLIMARSAVTTGNLAEAARYFAVSGCPTEYAALVKQWSAKGYPGETDLFICRAVLHTLSYDRTEDAGVLLDACASWVLGEDAASSSGSEVSSGAQAVLESPLWHFTRFVVELCQVKSLAGSPSQEMAAAFNKLREVYRASLERDVHLDDLLNRIGDVHFGIKPPQPGGLMGMLGQLMGGM